MVRNERVTLGLNCCDITSIMDQDRHVVFTEPSRRMEIKAGWYNHNYKFDC